MIENMANQQKRIYLDNLLTTANILNISLMIINEVIGDDITNYTDPLTNISLKNEQILDIGSYVIDEYIKESGV